jgi:Kef-type K+ transport system membrane component KefB
MFVMGLEFDFGKLRETWRAAPVIAVAGIVVPFGLSLILGPWIHSRLSLPVQSLGFTLFFATAMSITALPVLGRILIELNISGTKLGTFAITAAATDDVTGWLLLAMVSAVVTSSFHPGRFLLTLLGLIAYFLLIAFVVRPLLLKWITRRMAASGGDLSMGVLACVMMLFLASAAVTSLIGISSVFGAFLMGGILYDQAEFRDALKRRLHDFVTVFFLPLFFTYTGMRTDIRSMGGRAWAICALVIFVASASKVIPCTLAAKLYGMSWREACSMGAMMNTRGLMELIVLNAGYELGILPRSVFSIMVIMALFTTFITAPVLRRLLAETRGNSTLGLSEFSRWRRSASVLPGGEERIEVSCKPQGIAS